MPVQSATYDPFIAMLQSHEALIHKVCSVYAADQEDRKDLFQEVVLQAWRSFPKYNRQAKVSTWLYRVALNTALNHKRKKHPHQFSVDETVLHSFADQSSTDEEDYKIMHQLIRDLPPLEKALVLLYLEDNSYEEMAEIMGISVSNVGTKLNRIKEKLKKQAASFVQ